MTAHGGEVELAQAQARQVLGRLGQWRCLVFGPKNHAQDVAITTLGLVPYVVRWTTYWHGRGEAHQHDYYRCRGCHKIITWQHIRTGGCACGLSNKVSPAALTLWEKTRLVLFPTLGLARRWPAAPHTTATLYKDGGDA